MEMLEIKLDELWGDLLDSVIETPDTIKDLQKRYGLIIQFLSVAIREKLRLLSLIRKEQELSAEEYMKIAQEGVLKNLHYEERKKYQELRESESLRKYKFCLEKVNIQLDAVYSFEKILQTYFRMMQLDLHVSYGGHN